MATAARRTTSRSTNARGYGKEAIRNTRGYSSRESYVYGNTARALRPVEEVRSPKKLSNKARKNIDRDTSMNPGFMLFLTLAMVITGVVCIQYIKLQSSVTGYVS